MPSAVPLNKTALRTSVLAKREALSAPRPELAATLAKVFDGFQTAGRLVAFYHAIGSELDPALLVERAAAQGAELALPVLLDRQTMVFRAWDRSKQLVPVGFGTKGPDADQAQVIPDLIFAPLAGFSVAGQRIGYGQGHYDRCLARMHEAGHRPAFVGLAFDEQEVPVFERERHDVPLDGVLTPSGLRVFEGGQAALAAFVTQGLAAHEPL